jgi:hypothetical protein
VPGWPTNGDDPADLLAELSVLGGELAALRPATTTITA